MASGGAFGFIKGLVSSGPPETVTQKYARQDAELAAKSRPAAAPATAAPAPAPAPNTIAGYAGMSAMQRREKEAGLKNGGDLQTGQGGHVPGAGTGDKIPAKYEPGEFVVSNDMLAANPGMREQLHAVREQVLASQGKTPEQADARNAGVIAKLSAAKGFKPALAFASGGVVNDEEAQGAPADDEPPPQPPPLPPPAEPLPPISSIRGMQSRIPASGRPQTDLGFVNGGEVMRRAPSAHPTARGFKPALHFSTGGDDRKRNSFGDAAAATTNPAVAPTPAGGQPIPVSTQGQSNLYPYNKPAVDIYAAANQEIAGTVAGAGNAVKSALQGSPGSYAENNQAVGQSIKDSWGKGNYGEAAGKAASGTIGMMTTPLIDGAVRGGGAAWDGAKGFARGMFGMDTPAAAVPAGKTVPVANTINPPPAAGAQNPAPTVTPPPATPTANPYASTGNVTRVGNSYSGGNVAGDITINGQAPRNGGVISQLNQNAAQALSDRYQAEAVRGFQPAGQAAPELTAQQQAGNFTPNNGQSTGGFGILDKSYLDKRNASVALSSNSYSKGDREAAHAQIAAIDQRDTNATNNAHAVTRQGMADQTARRGQDIQARNTNAQMGVMQQRLGLDAQELGLKQTTAGFVSRKAAKLEALHSAYEQAKPQERPAIAEEIRVFNGQDKAPNWQGTAIAGAKNQDGSSNEGDIAIWNAQTGEVRRAGQGGGAGPVSVSTPAQLNALPTGTVYDLALGFRIS